MAIFERVYTVSDFYDGPRAGVANYRGQPHHYLADWDEAADEYAETFSLAPVDPATLSLVLEQWAIWRRWELAFHKGQVPQDSHPSLSGQPPRHAELNAILEGRFRVALRAVRARGVFKVAPDQPDAPPGVFRELVVEWTEVE